MQFDLSTFYEVLAPRPAVLITTIDGAGVVNAAPFSFIMPVSINPPMVVFGSIPTRHTLANVRETGEFVVNVVPEKILPNMIICSRPFPKGVDELKDAKLTERKSRKVRAPGVEECVAWLECRFEFEREAGDHIMVGGKVVFGECRDSLYRDGQFNVAAARPVLHIRGRRFVVADKVIEASRE